MPASKIGHIVPKVEDLDSALAFYCGVLGLKEVARRNLGEGPMAFLSTGNSHHDIALAAANSPSSGPGSLHHFALKVGDSLEDLRDVNQALAAKGIAVHMSLDHRVSQGIYISDPDGNLIFPRRRRRGKTLAARPLTCRQLGPIEPLATPSRKVASRHIRSVTDRSLFSVVPIATTSRQDHHPYQADIAYRQARIIVSCTWSSASWTEPSMRAQCASNSGRTGR
jgi:catechol 2,3-dioxygenase